MADLYLHRHKRKDKRNGKKEVDGKAGDVYNGIIGNTIIYQVEDAKFYTLEKDWNRVLSLYNNILRGYIRLEDKKISKRWLKL